MTIILIVSDKNYATFGIFSNILDLVVQIGCIIPKKLYNIGHIVNIITLLALLVYFIIF
jgi:hypothetical protein